MKRSIIIVAVTILVALATVAVAADCVTKRQCILWSDFDRFHTITKILVVAGTESQQLLERVMKDLSDGVAIQVPSGTRCKVMNEVGDVVYRVEINGVTLFGVAEHFKCDQK